MSASDRSERLAARTAVGDPDADADTDAVPIRGVAVGQGDVTKGQSGERTRWPADVLKDAAEALADEQAKLVRGPGGRSGHHPLDEQLKPDDIVGSVSFDYERGVGLTFDGELLDEQLARQIDMGLLEVSPDLLRDLGPPGSDGVREVESIISIPRVTLVDQAAGPSASVELSGGAPETLAEYLAEPPAGDRSPDDVEQLAASTLTMNDVVEMEERDRSAVEHLAETYGIDASAFGDEQELLAAVREARQ